MYCALIDHLFLISHKNTGIHYSPLPLIHTHTRNNFYSLISSWKFIQLLFFGSIWEIQSASGKFQGAHLLFPDEAVSLVSKMRWRTVSASCIRSHKHNPVLIDVSLFLLTGSVRSVFVKKQLIFFFFSFYCFLPESNQTSSQEAESGRAGLSRFSSWSGTQTQT